MTSWSNSVEDPEKHFLGNLLDDETSFSSSPSTTSRVYTESTTIPATSVLTGLGPLGPISGVESTFWPEPPPPYTQSATPWDTTTTEQSTTSSSSPRIHLFDGPLHTGLKGPSSWDSLLNFDTFNSSGNSQKPTEIHHHQHTHQHTHVLQVINKHHYGSPMDVPPGFNSSSQAFASVVRKAVVAEIKRPQHLPPHSAPVVHKMPFSYRDAVTKREIHSNGHSPTQTKGKVTTPENETKMEPARSTESIPTETEGQRNGKEAKKKLENLEFQKISRKRTSKEKRALSDTTNPPSSLQIREMVPVVDAPTRYQVLEKLASPKIVKAESVESDDMFIAPKAEKIEKSEEDHSPPRNKKCIITEIKKKGTPTTSTKRKNPRKKTESENWIVRLIWSYLIFFVEGIQDCLKWLMILVVDVCTRSGELFLYFLNSSYEAFLDFMKGCFQWVINLILNKTIIYTFRQLSIRQMFFQKPADAIWGLDENMALPNTTEEALERLLRVRRVDAYSILGLRADCSDDDLLHHYQRLSSLLNIEKTPLEGMEEAENVIDTAYTLIKHPNSREIYKLHNLSRITMHHDLLDMWDTLRMKVEESRHTMLCDCGKRHARIPTSIKMIEARFCKKCGMKHSAKPNDLWVESRLMGLAWIYYTCADGVVYDITEWATCDTNYLKHMKPNAHTVQYRLVSPGTPVDRSTQALQDLIEESTWTANSLQKTRAQVSYRPLEPRDEDRSRRAANRRQKRR